MIPPHDLIAGVILVSLVIYALTGGADYGGGVWDLLATGPTKARQRALIEHAIGPIWEANHIWLILVIVLLFSAFPPAFALITTALHVPLLLLLLGIVLRGAAFTFRTYDSRRDAVQRRWGVLFSGASVLAPVVLGIVVGAIASGRVRMEGGQVVGGWFAPWLGLWPLSVGLFTLANFSYIAAVYLCVEAEEATDPEVTGKVMGHATGEATALAAGLGPRARLQAERAQRELAPLFRARALAAWLAVTMLALFLFFQAGVYAPRVAEGLTGRWFSWPLHLATGASSLAALHFLVSSRFRWARLFAAIQVALIVTGWAVSQYPWIVVPGLTFAQAAAPANVLWALIAALAVGSVVLVPSLVYLFRAFKGEHPFSPRRGAPRS